MALFVLGLLTASPEASTPVADLAEQKEKQKQIQAETDRLIHRIETMILVLEYNRLDKTAEKRMLDEVGKVLSELSQEQMSALVSALEKAGKAAGADERLSELRKAQGYHDEIVLGLKGVLARLDAVKDLNQAADRLEKQARDEAEQCMTLLQIAAEFENRAIATRRTTLTFRIDRLASEVGFLRKDFTELRKQVVDLQSKLPAEQKDRVVKFDQKVRTDRVVETFDEVMRYARVPSPAIWKKATEAQWALSGQLQDLARMLRATPDREAVLRDARQRLVKAIEEQQKLRGDVITPPKLEGGDVVKDLPGARVPDPTRRGEVILRARVDRADRRGEAPEDPALVLSREQSSRQGMLEFDTRGTRTLL